MKHRGWVLACIMLIASNPVYAQETDFSHENRAPRPGSTPALVGPGCGTCDTTELVAALQACCTESTLTTSLLTTLTGCCDDVFTTLTECCNEIMTTLSVDVINTITECCSNLMATLTALDIASTFTTEVIATITLCCHDIIATITTDFQGTFTTLDAIIDSLNSSTTSTAAACCPCTIITQAAVDAAGGVYIISSPGNYSVAQDISVTGTAGIVIATSNVYLDLCSHKITGGELTDDGVLVNEGLNNITIANGLIDPINQNGIHILGFNINVRVSNIYVTGAGNAGIFCDGTQGPLREIVIENCQVELSATNATPLAGLALYNCANSLIQGGNYSNNGSTAADNAGGILCTVCADCRICNVNANQNVGQSSFGIMLSGCTNTFIQAAQTNDNGNATLSGGTVAGILSSDGLHTTICQSIASGNICNASPANLQACYGIGLISELYATVLDCVTEGNTSVNSNFNTGNVGVGIFINSSSFCSLNRNITSNNTTAGIYDTALTLAAGAGSALTAGNSTTLLSENTATDNGTSLTTIIAGANSNNYIIAYGGATPALPPTLFVSYSSATPFPAATTTQASLLGNMDIVS